MQCGQEKPQLTLNIPGLGELGVSYNNRAFWYRSASFPLKSIDEVRDAFFKAVEEQYMINVSRYLKSQPASILTTINSADDVKALFIRINSNGVSCPNDIKNLAPIDITQPGHAFEVYYPTTISAPKFSCLVHSPYYYNLDRVEQVSNAVATRVADAVHNSQITAFADRPDMFPPYVLYFFDRVFINERADPNNAWYLAYRDNSADKGYHKECYITGTSAVSPWVYLYPLREMEVKVTLQGSFSYSYPSLSNNSWTILAKPNGMLQRNSFSSPHLYYEYDKSKVTFTKPEAGFVVKKNEWEGFIKNTLAKKLGLTVRETDDLATDVRNALLDIKNANYSYLKVSFADPKEIDEKLPVTISPKPDTFIRIHLLLTPVAFQIDISEPSVMTIHRVGFTAVELGARVINNE